MFITNVPDKTILLIGLSSILAQSVVCWFAEGESGVRSQLGANQFICGRNIIVTARVKRLSPPHAVVLLVFPSVCLQYSRQWGCMPHTFILARLEQNVKCKMKCGLYFCHTPYKDIRQSINFPQSHTVLSDHIISFWRCPCGKIYTCGRLYKGISLV